MKKLIASTLVLALAIAAAPINLIAAGKAKPMIVVMPAGHTSRAARVPGEREQFSKEFLGDIMPYVEKHYRTQTGRTNRAMAGLSMGGGQSLNFGLANLDTFAWVGGFSSAPNTRRPDDLIKDHAEAAKKLRLLYVACGDKDGLLRVSEGVHKMLDEKKVPHEYRVIPGGRHDFKVWKSDLYHFARLSFRDGTKAPEKKDGPKPEAKQLDKPAAAPESDHDVP